MSKFDKNSHCEYCKKVMDSIYRNKRFCSDKCRVYNNREIGAKKNLSQISTKNVTDISKAEMWKLIKDGKI
jgi:predicted nucleic acid-binding Zn ribbon protein